MILLDGKKLSEQYDGDYIKRVNILMDKHVQPGLSIIHIGNNLESQKYIEMKEKKCQKIGIRFDLKHFNETDKEETILECIRSLNDDIYTHAIIVQLPIPENFNTEKILNQIVDYKDVDGFNIINSGNLYKNTSPLFVPCTPLGCMELLNHYGIELEGKNVVIIGSSHITGLPLSHLLLQKNATITLCHIYTNNIEEHTQKADILISCCGVPNLVKKEWIKENSILIDIGISIVEGKIIGDIDFQDVKDKVQFITPVPGGVGPMTVSMLINQTILSCERYIHQKL
tara:strand:- start:587 stop:1441 length:855 start_codon:yes stop_codon:yes gene_type:complete